jgi:hypothetical protein
MISYPLSYNIEYDIIIIIIYDIAVNFDIIYNIIVCSSCLSCVTLAVVLPRLLYPDPYPSDTLAPNPLCISNRGPPLP